MFYCLVFLKKCHCHTSFEKLLLLLMALCVILELLIKAI